MPDGAQQSFPTWVCLVDRFGGVPLKTHISLPSPRLENHSEENDRLPTGARVRGVPLAALQGARPLPEVRAQIFQVLRACGCRTLVGHGLTKDLTALGINAAADLYDSLGVRPYDTMSFRKFRGRRGAASSSRPLAQLAREFLEGRVIQVGQHDPEEDARAVIDLYVRHVDLEYMVEYETAKLLDSMRRLVHDDGDDEPEEDEAGEAATDLGNLGTREAGCESVRAEGPGDNEPEELGGEGQGAAHVGLEPLLRVGEGDGGGGGGNGRSGTGT